MLWLHEIHEVVGPCEEDFERFFRDEWMPAIARGDGARLLWYLHHAHGTGVSYHVVTITALRDGAAWESLVRRVDGGDLRDAAVHLDALRHDVTAKVLVPLPWSRIQTLDLEAVEPVPDDRDLALFMEDTVWPYQGGIERYVEAAGSKYAPEMERHERAGRAFLRLEGAFRTAFGSGRRREVILWQRIVEPRGLVPLLTREVPPAYRKPGTWMHDGLEVRDRWESKLLRTAGWSPHP